MNATSDDHNETIAAQANSRDWRTMASCPVGKTTLLVGRCGVEKLSIWDGRDMYWLGWYPMPERPQWLKDVLGRPETLSMKPLKRI